MSARHRKHYDLHQERRCERKERFDCLEDAAVRQKQLWENNKFRLVIYQCPFGEHFHLSKELREPAVQMFKILRAKAMREQLSTHLSMSSPNG